MKVARLILALILVSLFHCPAFSQVKSGTLIVIYVSQDKIVIAGDVLSEVLVSMEKWDRPNINARFLHSARKISSLGLAPWDLSAE
jgi:hypothetical protein